MVPSVVKALRVEPDIFLIRQRGREVAAAVGLEHQDQIRIATALSEIARPLLSVAGGADVVAAARESGVHLRCVDEDTVGISVSETTREEHLHAVTAVEGDRVSRARRRPTHDSACPGTVPPTWTPAFRNGIKNRPRRFTA